MGVVGQSPPTAAEPELGRPWAGKPGVTQLHRESPGARPALGLRALGSLKVLLPVVKHTGPAGEGGSGEVPQQPG